MKINKVSCTQFAGITNKELSFGDGINVVFGKNESGKSTVVNLISRLLFQNARIDGRSDKSFRELYFPAARKGSSFVGDYADDIPETNFELLTEEELELFKKAENCTTIEELQNLEKETSTINEGISQTSHIITDMTVEEFTKKYDLIDIKDLKGKYGF